GFYPSASSPDHPWAAAVTRPFAVIWEASAASTVFRKRCARSAAMASRSASTPRTSWAAEPAAPWRVLPMRVASCRLAGALTATLRIYAWMTWAGSGDAVLDLGPRLRSEFRATASDRQMTSAVGLQRTESENCTARNDGSPANAGSERQSALRFGCLQAATDLEALEARDDPVDLKACTICKASTCPRPPSKHAVFKLPSSFFAGVDLNRPHSTSSEELGSALRRRLENIVVNT
ncbi:unnamed protein product, partial [Effrenium voratum]